MNPSITIHNAETGEIETRDMNEAEFAQYGIDQLDFANTKVEEAKAEQAMDNAKASRDAKLAKMGFTAAEIENW